MTNELSSPMRKKTLDNRSLVLDLLRFPLAIVIVTVHIFGRSPEDFNFVDNAPIFDFVYRFIKVFLSSQSVPIYFFISGFVFFLGLQKWDLNRWINKLKNRNKSLLIPYLIWNTIFLLCMLFLNYKNLSNINLINLLSCYWGCNGGIDGFNATGMPINYPLWFLRDLMVMVLLTPLLFYSLKKFGKAILLFLFILWLMGYWGCIKIYMPTQALFFFSFGAYMSMNGRNMLIEFGKYSKSFVIVFFFLGVISMCFYGNTIFNIDIAKNVKPIMVFLGLFVAFNTSAWLLDRGYCRANKFLSSASFFIYVSHTLILQGVYMLSKAVLHPNSDIALLLIYILNVVLTIAISLVVFYLMSRYTPQLLSIVAGRKG